MEIIQMSPLDAAEQEAGTNQCSCQRMPPAFFYDFMPPVAAEQEENK